MSSPTTVPAEAEEIFILDVLRCASTDVLGVTGPLKMAKPTRFRNAPGEMREVDSLEEIRELGRASALRFLDGLRQPEPTL